MTAIFTDSAREAEFRRQGFVIVRLLSAQAAAALRGRLEEMTPSASGDRRLVQSFCTPDGNYRRRVDALGSSAVEAPLLALMNGYRLIATGIMTKPPGGSDMALHRDRTMLAEAEQIPVNVWCALVDIDDSCGNLILLPGSHTLGNIEATGAGRFYERYADQLRPLCVSYPLRAGEAVLFDNKLLHGSRSNRSSAPRPVLRSTTAPKRSRLVHYKLEPADGGRRFELLDVEHDGALAHSPDDFAAGTVTAPTVGFVENRNRHISFEECRNAVAAAGFPVQPLRRSRVAEAVGSLRALVTN